MKNKYFIITVDTEGDNLWSYKDGDIVHTKNALYIPRFQELCEEFGFKPVYLANYEMLNSDDFVNYIKPKVDLGFCEIGIHVHAWNNPPFHELKRKYNGQPYLIEYPYDIMEEKFRITYNLIIEKFGKAPTSHRAGRWAMDERYFKLLNKYGITVDCSFTPGIDWSNTPGATIGGSNYSKSLVSCSLISNVLEVPVSVRKFRFFDNGSFKHILKSLLFGNIVWPRPVCQSLKSVIHLLKNLDKEKETDYIEYMMHSSEMMPAGSPYFKNDQSIEELYSNLRKTFMVVRDMGYKGITLNNYYEKHEK